MKNFKYKLAITHYDQKLIDWCVGIGYEYAKNKCTTNNPTLLYNTWDENYSDKPGVLRIYDKNAIDPSDYIIDYKEHPELTKALLAATSDDYLHGFEYYSGIGYNSNPDTYIVLVNYKSQEIENFYKLNFGELLNHCNCKLSGKEIVSKDSDMNKQNERIAEFMEKEIIPIHIQLYKALGLSFSSQGEYDRQLERIKDVLDKETNIELEKAQKAYKNPSDLFYTCESCKHEPSSICLECDPSDKSKGWEAKRSHNPIDKVTTELLDVALRVCDIKVPYSTLDKIIDLVELIEDKGEDVSMKDILELKSEWNG